MQNLKIFFYLPGILQTNKSLHTTPTKQQQKTTYYS